MTFNSIGFLIFLPIVSLLYFLLPKRFVWVMLLAASYFFYGYWNWKLLYLILFTTFVSYICSILMERTDSVKKRRLLLVITLMTY